MAVTWFVAEHPCFSTVMVFVNLIIVWPAVKKAMMVLKGHVLEAAGESRAAPGSSVYGRGREAVLRYLDDIAKTGFIEGILGRAEKKLERAGYRGRGVVSRYILTRYLLPPLVFALMVRAYHPNIIKALLSALLVVVISETVVRRGRAKLEGQFNRNAYKIYKYLHNQVSSGISATEAVKTVYEVVNEVELRQALVCMAARYEITKDIESALEELVCRFDIHDTHTLCTAIRLGVVTGDNSEMLARQEGIMFKKYFNYIQSETEGCRLKSVVSAVFFTSVIIILISVPLIMDVMNSINNIFSG